MTISPQITDALGRLFNQLSQQSSLSGIIAIALVFGITMPHATAVATAVVAFAGIAKVLLPDTHSTVIGTQTVNPTVVVNTPSSSDVQS